DIIPSSTVESDFECCRLLWDKLGMLLLTHRQQLHQRPHGDPIDTVFSALVSQDGHTYRLRLHALESLNGGSNGFAHSENGVDDQHLLTLDSGETRVYSPGNFLLS